jgi:hypothetical protein
MKIYYRRSDGAYVETEGMTQDTIVEMLAGQNLTCEFISEQEYNAAVAAQA